MTLRNIHKLHEMDKIQYDFPQSIFLHPTEDAPGPGPSRSGTRSLKYPSSAVAVQAYDRDQLRAAVFIVKSETQARVCHFHAKET